jgi:predicted RNA polymerase sigma factor
MASTDVSVFVDRLWRAEAASMLGALSRRLGDFDLAEEALSEAVTAALKLWPVDGVPEQPTG